MPRGDSDHVSRAGLKLEAAVARFGLRERIRGARAVDVGASTGGFTACLLDHGARHVMAVDVGHGQLDQRLRRDPRVESLEGVDWRKLSLDVAAGPFDFFTVDVSFVSARNMLRGLAFRLRDGAEGVVLIKPQFELPSAKVREGRVDDPNLRRLAVERVREKAEALGFDILEHVDSPVAGGSGTVEILAHLRFAGRTARLPERRAARSPERRESGALPKPGRGAPTRAAALPSSMSWFAVASPGLEPVLEQEIAALPGARDVRSVPGGVELTGAPEVGLRANLWLRTATRVLARVGEVEARDFAKLRRRAAALPWNALVPRDRPLRVTASATRSRLYHTGALAETVALAISDHLRAAPPAAEPGADSEGDETLVLVRGVEDRFTLSIDTSGERLHRRGWRVEAGAAPLRETLAAGLIGLCGWTGETAFVDPMCGAGTLPIEACALALDAAPGLARAFAFERWPGLGSDGAELWAHVRDEARRRLRAAPLAPILASDREVAAVEIARRNAARAGFAAHIGIAAAELARVEPPEGPPGLVLLNPPYGRRLAGDLRAIYREIGLTLRSRFAGWRAGIVVPGRAPTEALGLGSPRAHRLTNGGVPIRLLVFDVRRSASR